MTPLSKVAKNTPVEIFALCMSDQELSDQLMHMGLFVGAKLHIHQTYPTYVLVSDEGTLAIEDELANQIMVNLL